MPASQFAAFITNPYPFIAIWWIGGVLTVFLPLSQFNKSKDEYYQSYGRYVEYEQKQRAYQEAQNANNNYYNNGQQGNNAYSNFNCGWWQYQCRQKQYYMQQQMNGGNDNNNFVTPNWYQFLGGVNEEEDRQMREEMGMDADAATGPVKFVYAWSIVLFIALLIFGTYVMMKRKSIGHLIFSLAIMVQYSLFILLLLPQGVISTDDRDMEDTVYGWSGQLPVLMVYYYYAQILFGSIFLVFVGAWAAIIKTLSSKDVNAAAELDGAGSKSEKLMPSGSNSTTMNKFISSFKKATEDPFPVNKEETTAGFKEASALNIA